MEVPVRLIMKHCMGGIIVFYASGVHLYLCSMATRIINKPTGTILSSAIGDIVISSDASFVDGKLTATGSIVILEERYYSFRNEITLNDISSLIEAQMRKMGETISSFTLSVYANGSSSVSDSCSLQILYCDQLLLAYDISTLLKENFLTTLDYRRIAPDATISLFLYVTASESLYIRFQYTYKTSEGETGIGTYSPYYIGTSSSHRILQYEIACDTLLTQAAKSSGYKKEDLTLLSFTAEGGQRAMTFFIDSNLRHTDSIFFRNCFNVWDFFTCRMQTTANSETDRQLAIINNTKQFYDQVTTKSYDVETGPLTSGESEWIDQLFTSYDVMRIEVNPPSSDDELSLVPILITDSTCETTENPDQPNSVKFTWQNTDNRPIVRLSSSRNIFTSPYTLQFS